MSDDATEPAESPKVEVTADSMLVTAPAHHDQLRRAGADAVVLAKQVETRYGEGNPLSVMLRTANDFVQDVQRYDRVREAESDSDADAEPKASGQLMDVLMLLAALEIRTALGEQEANETYEQAQAALASIITRAFEQTPDATTSYRVGSDSSEAGARVFSQ